MKNIILIFGVLLFSCSTSKKSSTDNSIVDNKIIGRWCSKSSMADYPHLTFRQDGYVIFDCKIDTVFGLKYAMDFNYLLVTPTNKPISKSKVLKLTQDSLILETLLELQMKQVYYRCDN